MPEQTERAKTEEMTKASWSYLNAFERKGFEPEGAFEGLAICLRDVACHAEDLDVRRKAGYALFMLAIYPRRKKLTVGRKIAPAPKKSLHKAVVELAKTVYPNVDVEKEPLKVWK
jgi:hypothetical protein